MIKYPEEVKQEAIERTLNIFLNDLDANRRPQLKNKPITKMDRQELIEAVNTLLTIIDIYRNQVKRIFAK